MALDLTHANLFDLSLKLLLRRHPEVVFRLVKVQPEPGSIRSAPTGVIVKELSADDVFIYDTPNGPEALYVEYQLEPDRKQVRRWLQKAFALEEELGMPVVLLVIYLRRGDRATFPRDFTVGKGPLRNHYEFEVIRLWEQAERIRGGELPELVPLLPLTEDRPGDRAVRESREIIQNLPLPADVRSELLGVSYLIGLKYLLSNALNAIFREELPMLKEAGIIGEWIEESLQKGREEQARGSVLRFIQKRFGAVPEELRQRISTADAEWCEALIFNAAEVESLSELRLP
jgi:predicted transposase YdaD